MTRFGRMRPLSEFLSVYTIVYTFVYRASVAILLGLKMSFINLVCRSYRRGATGLAGRSISRGALDEMKLAIDHSGSLRGTRGVRIADEPAGKSISVISKRKKTLFGSSMLRPSVHGLPMASLFGNDVEDTG